MKVKFTERHNTHANDCWCDAISLLTGEEYNTIYKRFKPLLYASGGLEAKIITGYLQAKGYFSLDISINFYEAINLFNTTNGVIFQLVINGEGHTIYMKDNLIYDNEDDSYIQKMLYDYTVVNVIMELENDYE